MDKRIEKLKNGENVQRVIDYYGHRLVEHFQPNKDHPGTYDRYFLPLNRDKSKAVQQNYALDLIEVELELNKSDDTGFSPSSSGANIVLLWIK